MYATQSFTNVETDDKLLGQTPGWVGELLRKATKSLALEFPFLIWICWPDRASLRLPAAKSVSRDVKLS